MDPSHGGDTDIAAGKRGAEAAPRKRSACSVEEPSPCPPSRSGGCHATKCEGSTATSRIFTAEGTRSLSSESFGWAQMSANAGLGRIRDK